MKTRKFLAIAAIAAALAVPASAQDTTATDAVNPQVELTFWESIKDSQNPDLFLAYLQRYPDGVFAIIAEAKLKELYGAAAAPAAVPAAPVTTTAPAVEPEVEYIEVAPAPKVVVRPAAPAANNNPDWAKRPSSYQPKVTKGLQARLRDVGCYTGKVDGAWGPQSIQAMRKFNAATGRRFPTTYPTAKALQGVRSYSGRICR